MNSSIIEFMKVFRENRNLLNNGKWTESFIKLKTGPKVSPEISKSQFLKEFFNENSISREEIFTSKDLLTYKANLKTTDKRADEVLQKELTNSLKYLGCNVKKVSIETLTPKGTYEVYVELC